MILAVVLDSLFVKRLGPWLQWNVSRLQIGCEVEQMLHGIGGHPEAREIDLAIRGSQRRRFEIDLPIRRARQILVRVRIPLRGDGH